MTDKISKEQPVQDESDGLLFFHGHSLWEVLNKVEEFYECKIYGVLDLHASYDIPFELGPASPQLFLHVFNMLDEVYVQDATDNSRYNDWDGNHTADDAEVFMGAPTSFNIGLKFNF